jgi:integrase
LAAIAIVVVLVTGRALRVGVVHASYVAVYGLGALAAVVGWATVDGCASWVSILVESLQDLDLDAERLTVKQSLLMLGGKAVIQARKSKAALRSVRLTPDAAAAVRPHKIRQEERELASAHWKDTGLVFTSGIGTALSPRNVGRSFGESIARAGVPKMRLHDLRHVNASLDLSTGTSVKAVAARLGHSDPSITLRTYAHVMPHEEPMAAQRLGALLSIETG